MILSIYIQKNKRRKYCILLIFNAYRFAVWTRLELATSCVTGRHSNQLNYHTVFSVAPVFLKCSAKIALFFLPSKKYRKIFVFFLSFYSLLNIEKWTLP